jgi:O-antigen/teichoic acid export membrane protein
MHEGRAHPLWSVVEAGLTAGLSFLSAFAIARIVGPAELGIGVAAVAVHVLLWVAVNGLFADPLTQSTSTDPREISSAFWAATAVGFLAALVQAACGPLLAILLDDARLVPMCLLLALPLPLVGAAGAVQGLLTRARRYDVLAGRAAVGQGLGTALGIAAAFAGAGAWALVGQQLATSLIGAALLLARARWRPTLAWRGEAVRAMLRVGLPITASTFVQIGRYRLFVLVMGGLVGPAALGQLHLAFRLVDTVRDLVGTALWRLLLPELAERQNDLVALRAGIHRSLGLYSLALFPLCGAMLVMLEPLTLWLLGPTWAASGEAALPLIGLMAWTFLAFPAGVAVIARGEARLWLITNLACAGLTLVGAAMLQPETPLQAVWIWIGAQVLVLPFIVLRTAKILEQPPLRCYQAGLPALAASGLAALVAMWVPFVFGRPANPMALVAERLVVFALAYLPFAIFALRGMTWNRLRTVSAFDAAD